MRFRDAGGLRFSGSMPAASIAHARPAGERLSFMERLNGPWHERAMQVPLVLIEAPFRDLGPPLLEEIRRHTGRGDTVVTVVLPEFIPRHWWENLLHNQTALYFKRLLLSEQHVVLTSVPFHLRAPEVGPVGDGIASS